MRGSIRKRTKKDSEILPKREKIYRRIIEYGILGLIIFTPLPAASVYEWSILVIQLTVFSMMIAYVLMREKPLVNKHLIRSMKWPKYLFFGLFIFLFFQIVPIPVAIVKIISHNSYYFRETFSVELSSQKFMSISLIPSRTIKEGLELLAYVLLGFLIIKTVRKNQIKKIYYALICMGIFQAFYGMFELYNKNPRILFYNKIYSLDSVTGTFVNRNHFSGYMEMILPLAIGLIVARIDIFTMFGSTWRDKLIRLSERGLATNLMIIFGILGMSISIIFSKSRSGIFLLVFTFFLFFGFSNLYFRNMKGKRQKVNNILKVMFLVMIVVVLYIGIGSTLERFALDEIMSEDRPVFWANTAKILTDFPLFGSGLGTFSSIYPGFESLGMPINIYHTHNDYLEYLSELGCVGMIMLLGSILIILKNVFRIWRKRRHREVIGLALGGIVSLICIFFHSITDFNLHIPANMLLFSVVLSLTAVMAMYEYHKPDEDGGMLKLKSRVSKIIAEKEKQEHV